jgi:hypothetical protein
MSELEPRDAGKLALGGFFVAFANVEVKIGDVLKAILKAEDHQQDLIVAAIGNFAQKANAVKAGLSQATTLGAQTGTDRRPALATEWIEAGIKAMNKALSINDNLRVRLAHGFLEQVDDGSFRVTHLKISGGALKSDPIPVSVADLTRAISELEALSGQIAELRRQLASVTISISLDLTMDNFGVVATASTHPTEIR